MKDAETIEIPLVEPVIQHFNWIEAWTLAVFHPSVSTFRRLLADPAASKKRATGWLWSSIFLYVLAFLAMVRFGSYFGLPDLLDISNDKTSLVIQIFVSYYATPIWLFLAATVLNNSPITSSNPEDHDRLYYALATFLLPLALAIFAASIISQWLILVAAPFAVLVGVLFGLLALGLLAYQLYLGALALEAAHCLAHAQAMRAMIPACVLQSALIAGLAYLQFGPSAALLVVCTLFVGAFILRSMPDIPHPQARRAMTSAFVLQFLLVGGLSYLQYGPRWTPASAGLTNPYVSALAVAPESPSTLYAGGWDVRWVGEQSKTEIIESNVFKSTNDGVRWHRVNTETLDALIWDLVVDPQTPATLYLGTSRGVRKSTDGGATWQAADLGPLDTAVYDIAMDPSALATLYAGTDFGVRKTTDGGARWEAADTGLKNEHVRALAIDPAVPATLYAGTEDHVFKSTDGGATWRAVSAGQANAKVWSLAIDPVTPSTLYAGTSRGVYKSTDGGATWRAADAGLATDVYALVIDLHTPKTLYAATDHGVYKSTDGGFFWRPFRTGLHHPHVRSLAIDPRTPATIYAGMDGGKVSVFRPPWFSRWSATGG
jgi:photosystem II stability/assembly factor-like uncharacterized protein